MKVQTQVNVKKNKTSQMFHVGYCGVVEPEYDFVRPLKDMDTREKEACEFECEVNDADARVTWYREDKVKSLSHTGTMIVR